MTRWKVTFGAALSPREEQCVSRLAKGLRLKEICAELEIAGSTYHTHMHRVSAKLGARNHIHAAVIYATRQLRAEVKRLTTVGRGTINTLVHDK